jgi:exodeoxyribonuclease VII small subunit
MSTNQAAGDRAALPDPAQLPYEAARDELVDIVRRLESGGSDLEESLALWERGEALAARCQEVLDGAIARLDAATGTPGS